MPALENMDFILDNPPREETISEIIDGVRITRPISYDGSVRVRVTVEEQASDYLPPKPPAPALLSPTPPPLLSATLLRLVCALITTFRTYRTAAAKLADYEATQFAGTPEYAQGHWELAHKLHMARRALETAMASAQYAVDLFTPKPPKE